MKKPESHCDFRLFAAPAFKPCGLNGGGGVPYCPESWGLLTMQWLDDALDCAVFWMGVNGEAENAHQFEHLVVV